MWHAFAAFCATRALDLDDVRPTDIEAFFHGRSAGKGNEKFRSPRRSPDLSLRYCWRMLTLIDRMMRFVAQEENRPANTAAQQLLQQPAYRYANASHTDPLPEYYTEAQAERLIAYLTAISHADTFSGPVSWKEARDRTAVALMLGGGLSPGDVRALVLRGVVSEGGREAALPWKLALPGNGNSPARETPLAQWAGRQLAFWMTVRTQQGIAGELVLPSTAGGKPWSHTACYESCKEVLARAGMEKTAGGVFQLRHTFALRQLNDGKTDQEVAQWLGLVDVSGMARYRRIVPHQVDVV